MSPQLDVSEVLDDPLFVEQITVKRTSITTGSDGRAVSSVVLLKPYAVVNAGSSKDLIRTPDYEAATNMISVHVKGLRLIDPQVSKHPDRVVYMGDDYVVKKSDNYSSYGQGFTHADCELVGPVTSA